MLFFIDICDMRVWRGVISDIKVYVIVSCVWGYEIEGKYIKIYFMFRSL